ncbi:acetyl-CoA carboxylase biotin carboxyl carrier protein [Nocardia shimofusensis]|uniref:acetyl-CoA carboxylase biotin carboxyl carrier protein n=1 Tax=Nocardia shimofusensis TaxID=228596 RepID=UPI0008314F80|nr:acetyl-CoA carboxylase biotin carboxyl carrier protein subunit [Nocardia shimofusensis]
MTQSLTHPRSVRAMDPVDADLALTVLARHAMTILAEAAPYSVTLANGPLMLEITRDNATVGADSATSRSVPAGTASRPTPVGVSPEPASPATEPAPEPLPDNTFTLAAETVGVFYRSPEPGADPFVTEGDPVRVGQQVGIVEAMKLMIPVVATREGRVAEFLVENGEAVEYGAALLVLEVVA